MVASTFRLTVFSFSAVCHVKEEPSNSDEDESKPVTHGSANVNSKSVCFLGRERSVLDGKEGKKDML